MAWPRKKRQHQEVVDLTDDSNESQHQAKRPTNQGSHNRSNGNYGSNASGNSNGTSNGYRNVYSQDTSGSQEPSHQESETGHLASWSQAASEEQDILNGTQLEDEPARELYGYLHNKIVGIRYYNGLASRGEVVLCHREPNNKYDRNAIRVDNVMHQQVGHLPRKVAEKLAPYLDNGDVDIEAELTGNKGAYDCPVQLALYGLSDTQQRARIENALKADKLLKATELKQTRKDAEARRAVIKGLKDAGSNIGLESASQQELHEMTIGELEKASDGVDLRSGRDALGSLELDNTRLSQMPMAEQPKQLKAQLLPYQLQGLRWMSAKEHPKFVNTNKDEVIQLWKQDKADRFVNLATGFVTKKAPALASGGILADDMGLGKTLQIISLILTGGPGATLIVAPVSVMTNWEQQIRRHVHPDQQPKILTYHSGNPESRKLSSADLHKYDVVITSYGKLARERDNGVRKVLTDSKKQWRRVVLDEGHTVRNVRTKVAAAACDLNAQSRWALTGTPIINSVKDLQSLVRFLHLTGGIEQPDIFNTAITRKLSSSGDNGGYKLLVALLQDICLRRRKDMDFVDLKLPEKKEYVHRVTFRPEEKHKYDILMTEARGAFEEYQANSEHKRQGGFQNVLERLLRLRQTCNHWTLCKQRIDDLLQILEDQDVVVLNEKNRALLQAALRMFIESQEDCAICYDIPTDPVITNCKHVFCRSCITKAIELQGKCPMCRNGLSEERLLEPAPEAEQDDNFDVDTQSSKTEAMMQIVNATLRKEGSKIIIFSQWTSFLNILQNQLGASNHKCCRLDGSMNTAKRDAAIAALDDDPDVRIMLASLAACSVGLNLVSADTVILADTWWAPAIEDQAVDRVHRLGQTRETTVWRMIMENSVEERVLDIQTDKRDMVRKAFQEKDRKQKQAKVTRVGDIKKLLA